jgi:hypothetical protein
LGFIKRNILPEFLKFSFSSCETEVITFNEQVCASIPERRTDKVRKSKIAFFIGGVD